MGKKAPLLDRWQSDAQGVFQRLPGLPAELNADLEALIEWHTWVGELLLRRDEMIARLDRQWLEREEANRRARIISQRQCMTVAEEQERAHLRKLEAKIQALRARIDRVCDQITQEMEKRRQQAILSADFDAAAQAQQLADDLITWNLFVRQLQDEGSSAAYDSDAAQEARRQAAAQARVQAEIRRLQQQPSSSATDEENQAAWNAFVQGLDNTPRKKR